MKALTRFYVWWPSIDEDIDLYVKKCKKCQESRPNNPELPVYSWSIPDNIWERIHIDFAGRFEQNYWLVLSDALSKWIEIKPVNKINTKTLCETLEEIFCTFGYPKIIVSDNGPQFTASEFKKYCDDRGIQHITTSPYHPRTNGLAERLVRTFKSRMLASGDDILSQKQKLLNFLFSYRNTPHTTTGKSPAQMMFGRQLPCLLDNIRPNKKRELQFQQIKENILCNDNKIPNFCTNDGVYICTRLEKSWKPATILKRTNKYSYIVKDKEGVERRRHTDQIRPRMTPDTDNIGSEQPPRNSNHGESTEHSTKNMELAKEVTSDHGLRRSTRIRRPPQRYMDGTKLAKGGRI